MRLLERMRALRGAAAWASELLRPLHQLNPRARFNARAVYTTLLHFVAGAVSSVAHCLPGSTGRAH
jgi:hypothetical protein